METNHLRAVIAKKFYLTPTVLLVRLQFGAEQKILFQAGQHIIVKIPIGSEIADRPFSIASSPSDKDIIELIIKIIPHGVASSFFQQIKIGAQITVSQPRGMFSVASHTEPATFIASNTGIAPFRSMLYDLLENKKVSQPLHLVFFCPTKEEEFMVAEFTELSVQYKNFTFAVDIDLASYVEHSNIHPGHKIYLCGGTNFIRDSIAFLDKSGVKKDRIYYEKFE